MNKKILIVIAHPDDEILGVGGTIQKYILDGFIVDIFLLSSLGNARGKNEDNRLIDFKNVCDKLGINEIFYENYPDTSFDTIKFLDIVKSIENILDKSKPNIIFTHYYNDLNIDHCITSKALITAARPIEKNNFIKKIFLFEVPSSTELSIGEKFIPNYYVDITNYIEKKLELFTIYGSENREYPHPRSLIGLKTHAIYRGMESGLNYAEAFILYRSIN